MLLMACAVFCGGLGVCLRGILQMHFNLDWPLGTWLANALGSFFAGFCVSWLPDNLLRQALLIGFCGALTTLSSVCVETLFMLEQRRYYDGAMHFLGTGVFCLFICFLGMKSAASCPRWGA